MIVFIRKRNQGNITHTITNYKKEELKRKLEDQI